MRILAAILSWPLALLLVACAHRGSDRLSWKDQSALPKDQDVASLNQVAAGSANSADERAKAIFTLFAHSVRPGFAAQQMRSVLRDTNWMSQAYLYRLGGLGGWVPVELTSNDTIFGLLLFRESRPANPWHIWFRLSPRGEGESLSEQEAAAFLRGDTTLSGGARIIEFALCFPEATEYRGRIERYGPKGIHVYELVVARHR